MKLIIDTKEFELLRHSKGNNVIDLEFMSANSSDEILKLLKTNSDGFKIEEVKQVADEESGEITEENIITEYNDFNTLEALSMSVDIESETSKYFAIIKR